MAHVAGVYQPASGPSFPTISVYFDGLPVGWANVPLQFGPNSARLLILGRQSPTGTGLTGRVDEVKVYRHALTPTEVQLQYAAASLGACRPPACVEPASGLLVWWPGDGSALDRAGSHPGTLGNGAGHADGKVGLCFHFDGANDYVSFGNSVGNFGTSDFSVEFWMETSNGYQSVLGQRVDCEHGSFWDLRKTNGFLVAELDDFGAHYVHLTASRPLFDGLLHHVALVRQATAVSLFLDGALDYSVLYKDRLTDPVWLKLQDVEAQTIAAETVLALPLSGASQQFFRIVTSMLP